MVLKDNNDGPFWMTPEERESKRHSQFDEPTNASKTNFDLLRDLQKSGISMTGLKGNRVGYMQDLATIINFATVKRVKKDRVKGWMGKPKGLLQILWERGHIDTNFVARSYYTLGGWNDRYGNAVPDTSLHDLMGKCVEFIKEETLLQTQAHKMGNHLNCITVDRTPKCHPELAGKGIEYFWGCAKNFYKLIPLDEKKGKDNFRQSVKKATETENLTIAQIRMFSRRS